MQQLPHQIIILLLPLMIGLLRQLFILVRIQSYPGSYVDDQCKPDDYVVYVSTSSQTAGGCLLNVPFYTVETEQIGLFNQYTISLAEQGYSDQQFISVSGLTLLQVATCWLYDITIADDSVPQLANLTFNVNMSKYIAAGNFNPKLIPSI